MDADSDQKALGMKRLFLIARISAGLIVAFSLFIVVGHSVNPQASQGATPMEAFELTFFPFGMCVGYLMAFRWPLFGGLLSLASLAIFIGLMGNPLLFFVIGFLAIPGVLFVIYGLYLRDQRKSLNISQGPGHTPISKDLPSP
jgi:hypothetical protein